LKFDVSSPYASCYHLPIVPSAPLQSKVHFRGCPDRCTLGDIEAWVNGAVNAPIVNIEYNDGELNGIVFFVDEATARVAVARLNATPLVLGGENGEGATSVVMSAILDTDRTATGAPHERPFPMSMNKFACKNRTRSNICLGAPERFFTCSR
jgi:hypothetical protein